MTINKVVLLSKIAVIEAKRGALHKKKEKETVRDATSQML